MRGERVGHQGLGAILAPLFQTHSPCEQALVVVHYEHRVGLLHQSLSEDAIIPGWRLSGTSVDHSRSDGKGVCQFVRTPQRGEVFDFVSLLWSGGSASMCCGGVEPRGQSIVIDLSWLLRGLHAFSPCPIFPVLLISVGACCSHCGARLRSQAWVLTS